MAAYSTLVLRGPDLLHNNSVPALRRDIERLGGFRDSFFLAVGLDGAKMFSTLADEVYAPAGHGAPPHCRGDHVANSYDDDGGSDGNECIQENAMSSS